MLLRIAIVTTALAVAAPEAGQRSPDGSCLSVAGDAFFPSNHPGDYSVPCWGASIRVDSMTDKKQCSVQASQGANRPSLAFYLGEPVEAMFVTPAGRLYPGSRVQARVDSRPALTATEIMNGATYRQLLEDIQGGSELRVRYSPWPSGAPREATYQLEGAAEAIAWCREQLRAR